MGSTSVSHPSASDPLRCCLLGLEAHRLDSCHLGRGSRDPPSIPNARKIAPVCLPRGPKRSWANAVGSNGSSVAFFFSSICNVLPSQVGLLVVEHKDRLTRFGFKYIETLLAVQGRSIEVVNLAENPLEDLIADLVSIIYSFS